VTSHTRSTRDALSRRTLLRGGLGAVGGLGLAGALSGCGTALSAGVAGTALSPGTLTFWNLFGGGDGARLTVMLDKYAADHGGPSSLQAATFAWGNPYYTKVALATLGNKPPDVAVSHLTRAKNLAQADLLTPITDEMLASVGLKSTDFNQKVWEQQKLNGVSYAIPLDTHPYVMFYNIDVCRKAGLLDSAGKLKPIRGTAQWEAALAAAKKVTGVYGASTATVADNSTSWRWFQTLYSQMGGPGWLSDAGKKLTLDDDLTVKTLTYIQKLTKSGLMPTQADYATSQVMMFTGQSAFYLQGEWEITTAQAQKGLKFGMVPVPTLFDKPAAMADSHMFVLPRMNRTPDQTKRAMGFVKSMLDQSNTWAAGGHIPAYLPYRDSAAFKNLSPQSNYAGAADYAIYDSQAWYSGSGSNFENIVGAQMGLVQQGGTTPAAALSSMRRQLGVYTKTANPL